MKKPDKPFDASAIAQKNGNFFSFPYTLEEAEIVLLSLPWDVTTSYREGTSLGPRSMLEASYQLDFFSPYKKNAWETRIATLPERQDWFEKNRSLRMLAVEVIAFQETGALVASNANMQRLLDQVNRESALFHSSAEQEATRLLALGKKLLSVGGDHSVSLGPIRAHAKKYGKISILHLDAHADLRKEYEGFSHSHASIMDLVAQLPEVEKIVQVGLRDISPDEMERIQIDPKIQAFFDWDLSRARAGGKSWKDQCTEIIAGLGKQVYISFDIDGLDPRFCPHTGTPVPGGLEYADALYLFEEVVRSGRKIIGADLVEVAPGAAGDEWDANVGARILFQLCQFMSL